jgi:hypothetical protein
MVPFLLLIALLQKPNFIERVKVGELTSNPLAPIGLVFDNYSHFEAKQWRLEREGPQAIVLFEGLIADSQATADYYQKHRNALSMNFKAMQLEPYYGLTKDKVKLRYRIRFRFLPEGGFTLASGELGILNKKGVWRDKALSPKSLKAIVDGIYANENPYVSLIKGLPYK